jgi:hypothetical protein
VPPPRLPHHHYSLLTISFSLQVAVGAHPSLGGVARLLPLVDGLLGQLQAPAALGTPCRQTLRLWQERLGLYLLQRPCARRTDWTWIIDHTLQWGTQRAFVVLGVSGAQLAATGFCLTLGDVQLLLAEVVEHSDGPRVQQQLQALAERVGVPRQIVSDHGSDLVKGIHLFRAARPEQGHVLNTYDVTHKLACLLKALLGADPRWRAFGRQCAQAGQELRQTRGAFLQPPTPRPKARFMNLDTQVQWAARLLRLWPQLRRERLAALLGKTAAETDDWLEAKLGWLQGFREEVACWSELVGLAQQVRQQVRQQGLARESAAHFRQQIRPSLSGRAPVQRLASQVEAYLEDEGAALPAGAKVLGSSEVLESAFGSFKNGLARSGWPEIGRNLLLLPLLLCQWGVQTVAAALQTVSCQAVRKWVRQELGPSQQSKYRQVLGRRPDPAAGEQKPPPPAPPPPETAIPGDGSGRSPPEDRNVA